MRVPRSTYRLQFGPEFGFEDARRLVPYLAFALQHLEVAIHIEKRVLVKRGILPNARMRHPTITLDSTYQRQMDDLVQSAVELVEECKRNKTVAV